MDDKNVVKKRVTLAIVFAVFIVVVIAVILLIKPVISKVQENRTAKVSQETAQEAQFFFIFIRMHLMYSMVQWIHQMRKETAS